MIALRKLHLIIFDLFFQGNQFQILKSGTVSASATCEITKYFSFFSNILVFYSANEH